MNQKSVNKYVFCQLFPLVNVPCDRRAEALACDSPLRISPCRNLGFELVATSVEEMVAEPGAVRGGAPLLRLGFAWGWQRRRAPVTTLAIEGFGGRRRRMRSRWGRGGVGEREEDGGHEEDDATWWRFRGVTRSSLRATGCAVTRPYFHTFLAVKFSIRLGFACLYALLKYF
jgi:hypothetical protein